MIVRETVNINNRTFTRTYSDAGKIIRKVGTDEMYNEAYDLLDYSYEETDMEVQDEPDERLS